MILRRSKAVSVSESPKDGKADSDTRLELAYAAGQARLSGQDATLGNLRSRANNLLATSALLSSLATGIGLLNTDPKKGTVLPASGAWVLLLVTVVLGTFVIYVLWPAKGWDFGPSAKEIMNQRKAGKSEDSIREHIIAAMIEGIDLNFVALARKQKAFRFAAGFLLLEVVVLLAALILQN